MTFTRAGRYDFKQYAGDPCVRADVVISIDVEKLMVVLGHKATFSKGKKSRAMNGAIIVKSTPVV